MKKEEDDDEIKMIKVGNALPDVCNWQGSFYSNLKACIIQGNGGVVRDQHDETATAPSSAQSPGT